MKKTILLFLFTHVIYSLSAQKIEAESATLAGGTSVVNNAASSGGKYVAMQEGNLSFTISKPSVSYFDIYINTKAGSHKENNFVINGNSTSFSVDNTTFSTLKVASFVKLLAGTNTINITKSWGWIDIDFIELVEVNPTNRFNINKNTINPNSTPEAQKLYDFLLDNYGSKIISGAMTLNSFDESDWLKQQTGKEPALLGIDFMQTNRGYTWYSDATPANDAKIWYNKNGIPAMMWHWRDPSRVTEEFYSPSETKTGTNFNINDVFNPTSNGYKQMIADIDFVAGQFKILQNDGVPVLWRPLHEAAGGWFWWGAKGAAPCKELWHVMYDRMVNYHGLNNLIWVWTREPGDEAWYPGDEYVDIVGRDIYKDGDHTSQILEFNNMNDLYGGKKMIALSESGSFPDVDNLQNDLAAWSWWMPWYGDYTRSSTYNSLNLWKKMFASEYVITLDEMPNLRTYQTITSIEKQSKTQSSLLFPTIVVDELNLESEKNIESITITDLTGKIILERIDVNDTHFSLQLTYLEKGIYVALINGAEIHRFIKE